MSPRVKRITLLMALSAAAVLFKVYALDPLWVPRLGSYSDMAVHFVDGSLLLGLAASVFWITGKLTPRT